VEPAKPSLELLRSLTDEHVLRALMRQPRLTRAELAAATGISKPTVGESVRRLVTAGLVADTGERTAGGRGRGRVGTYYALAADVGFALAASIAPEGIVAECINPYGTVISRAEHPITRPAHSAEVAAALHAAATQAVTMAPTASSNREAPSAPEAPTTPPSTVATADPVTPTYAAGGLGGPVRLAVVSAADPVDRATGRMVHLPDSPFLLGDLDPVAVLAPLVAGPITVDNDVNWAARAERAAATRPEPGPSPAERGSPAAGRAASAGTDSEPGAPGAGAAEAGAADVARLPVATADASGLDDFAYLYLGEGLGCAVVSDGEVRRGHAGLAGEIAHLLTVGPDGQAVSLIDVFGQLGLRQPGTTAIDPARLLAATTGPGPQAPAVRRAVATAVAGAIAAVVALADPAEVILGGPWGHHPDLTAAIAVAVAAQPRPVPVRAAALTAEPSLAGARSDALLRLQAAIVTRAQAAPGAQR
jgi:predicted NBD/HSP70 family sugar kinase/DNA-binding transcriptional ArsR family regulator